MPGRPEPVLIDLEHPTFPPEIAELRASDPAMRSLPCFKRMHEMTTDHVHEEIQLLALDMSTMLLETMAPMGVEVAATHRAVSRDAGRVPGRHVRGDTP